MEVVVPYARNRIAYAVAKSLSEVPGTHIYTADSIALPMSLFSRHTSWRYFRHPCPWTQEADFVAWARDRLLDGYTIFPTWMESWVLSKYKLAPYMPSYSTIMQANDKWAVHTLCERLGIPTPPTVYITTPKVFKPLSKRGSDGRVYLGDGILQERVYGDAIGVGMMFIRGELRAKCAWKRLAEYPRDGGMSVVRESIRASQQEEHAEALLEALNWHGPAMVEFKGDYVLEINPRLWGSLQLSIDAGVDFPKLILQMLTHGDCHKITSWRTGVVTSYLAGCLRTLQTPRGHLEDFSFSDPLPFFAQFATPLGNALRGKGWTLDTH